MSLGANLSQSNIKGQVWLCIHSLSGRFVNFYANNIILFLWVHLLRFFCGFGCYIPTPLIVSIFSCKFKEFVLALLIQISNFLYLYRRDLGAILDDRKCMNKTKTKPIDMNELFNSVESFLY
ncbi:hypothetical protein L2E82_12908 [Cichorium intybus]|uniref:Uncharacterized protein n=1 Tax=Cichorium intybus TaxID=13427 RepID=A0ACB9GHD1_CICIN|nr:hypothetical protein L2E82_12908 [Cichorium intybus]